MTADGNQLRPQNLLGVTSHDHDGIVLLTVSGEVDLLSGPILDEAITTALAGRPPILVIDMTDVSFLPSAGITLLIKAHRAAGDLTRVRVAAPERSVVERTLRLTGMLQILDVVPTRAAGFGR